MYGCAGRWWICSARADLDDPAGVHDRDAVGDLEQQREVVRDEQDGEVQPLLQLDDLREDLPLHDDVERRRRLVHDHDLGSTASAIAIITRWRMPPESSCG